MSNIPSSARAGFVPGYGGKSCPDCGSSVELIEEEGYRVYVCNDAECKAERDEIAAVEAMEDDDLPDDCECDNTHEQNQTVCRYCWAQGIRHESARRSE